MSVAEQAWGRYRILIASTTNGPTTTAAVDDLAAGGERQIVELVLAVYADLYCERCDTEIAALEPNDVLLIDVVSVIQAHELVCVPATSWAGDDV